MSKKLDNPATGSFNPVLDSMEFVKRAWSGFNLRSSFAPTMDLEELDKRIADLKAVEQWLNVNLSMLHGTVQGLEMQRGTLAAMQAFGNAVATSSDSMTQIAEANRPQRAASAASEPDPAESDPADPGPAESAPPAAAAPVKRATRPSARSKAAAADSAVSSPMSLSQAGQVVNPSAWWNLLQGQFDQVARAALGASATLAAKPAAKPAVPEDPAPAPGRAAPGPKRPPRPRAKKTKK
jgi:hypothetical protein